MRQDYSFVGYKKITLHFKKLNVIKLRSRVARRGVRVADKMLLIIAGIAV